MGFNIESIIEMVNENHGTGKNGFHISGDKKYDWGTDLSVNSRQTPNLSPAAYEIINGDMKDFSNGSRHTISGFLNVIFKNFYQDADASISQRYMDKQAELSNLFSSSEFRSVDKKTTAKFVSKLLDDYQKKLVTKAWSHEKGKIVKFIVNKDNTIILRGSNESVYYPNSNINAYLKAIFEEYASKPMCEREKIYFKDTVDTIQSAIAQKKCLKISLLKTIDQKSKRARSRTFWVRPYKIVQDSARMFNYLVGYSEEINQETQETDPGKIVCYRISRICEKYIYSAKSGFLSQETQEMIDAAIAAKGPQFLADKVISLKVRFTDVGIEYLNRHLYMRPGDFNEVENEPNTYVFRCTEFQAMNYFFKFGAEAEILEPKETRNTLMERYKNAYMLYTNESE